SMPPRDLARSRSPSRVRRVSRSTAVGDDHQLPPGPYSPNIRRGAGLGRWRRHRDDRGRPLRSPRRVDGPRAHRSRGGGDRHGLRQRRPVDRTHRPRRHRRLTRRGRGIHPAIRRLRRPPRTHPLGGSMTTIYVRHDVTTIAEVNALALNEDQRENGAIVLYDGNTCYWSINWATRNEIPGRWYDNHRDGSRLVDGDEVTVLVPVEAEEEFGAGGDGMDEDFYLTRRLVTPWTKEEA